MSLCGQLSESFSTLFIKFGRSKKVSWAIVPGLLLGRGKEKEKAERQNKDNLKSGVQTNISAHKKEKTGQKYSNTTGNPHTVTIREYVEDFHLRKQL